MATKEKLTKEYTDPLIVGLIEKLNTLTSFGEEINDDSIMRYGTICEHDDGYLCEHRLEWILKFIENEKLKN